MIELGLELDSDSDILDLEIALSTDKSTSCVIKDLKNTNIIKEKHKIKIKKTLIVSHSNSFG